MTYSIKDFSKNFQAVKTEQLRTVIGGNGELVQPLAFDKRKKKFG